MDARARANDPDGDSAQCDCVCALDRQKVTLPAEFTAARNVLIIGFQLDQQQALDDWFVAAGPGEAASFQRWILPIFPRENFVYRWWQNASLRGRLAPGQPRHYTVPLYVDMATFLQGLRLPSQPDVLLLVTDRAGHVLWQTVGPVDENKKNALAAYLKQP